MPPVHTLTTRSQKRKRSPEIDPPTESTPPPEPPWKRAGFRSAEQANTAFWDNLSKVPLCPPALRELGRRNWLCTGPATKSVARSAGPTTRSATRRAAQVNQLGQNSTVLEDCAAQLKRFARRGGPDLHDLGGYPEPSEVSLAMPPNPKSISPDGRKLSAYNPGFEQHLINHDVYPYGYRSPDGNRAPKPGNWQEIQQRLAQPRPSLSPSQFSDEAFENFVDKITEALDEADVMANVFPILRGESDIPSGIKKTFRNLTVLTDGTLVDAQPDIYYGAHPDQLDPRVREKLNSYIVPSVNDRAPILSNNFTEGKGPGGTRVVAGRQACYDGALGARGMQQLQSYGRPEPVYDNNAYTITSIFDGYYLEMYTTHLTAPTNPGGKPEYHMNQLNSWVMTNRADSFRQGSTAYRNARDWAKKQRDDFIDAANERAANLPQDTSFESSGYNEPSTSTNRVTAPESDTSAGELTLGDDAIIRRSGKHRGRGEPERDRW